jgi:hypothetical protein
MVEEGERRRGRRVSGYGSVSEEVTEVEQVEEQEEEEQIQ